VPKKSRAEHLSNLMDFLVDNCSAIDTLKRELIRLKTGSMDESVKQRITQIEAELSALKAELNLRGGRATYGSR
jgi:hypothetical protein